MDVYSEAAYGEITAPMAMHKSIEELLNTTWNVDGEEAFEFEALVENNDYMCMVILYRDEMRPSAREMVGSRSLVWYDDGTAWMMHNGCIRDTGIEPGGILLDTIMTAFLKMGKISFPAGQFREPAFYVEVDGGNAVNLRLYQNYRSHIPGMEQARFHAVSPSEKRAENKENEDTLCAFRWPVAAALGERRRAMPSAYSNAPPNQQ